MKTKLCYKEFTSSNGFEELIEEVNKEIPDSSMIISIKSEEKLIKHVNGYIDSYFIEKKELMNHFFQNNDGIYSFCCKSDNINFVIPH